MSYECSLPMAMLPNDSHPGPGCSCEACMREFPDEPEHTEMDGDQYIATLDNGREWPMADSE